MKYILLFCLSLLLNSQPKNKQHETIMPLHNPPVFKALNASKTKILFSNNLKEDINVNPLGYQYVYNGGGVALGDINNDGLTDIYFTGNMVDDKLYLNKGNMEFEDITSKAIQKTNDGWHTGVTMADVNSDGFLDIYVCRAGPANLREKRSNLLYINNKDLTFTESALEYGLADTLLSTQAAFFDFDFDGDLDVYVMNIPYMTPLVVGSDFSKEKTHSESDHIYENRDGKYIDITEQTTILDKAFGLGLSISDFDDDGYPDIYIANDYDDPDILYWNKGGTFNDEIKTRTKHTSQLGMGTDIADINNDGAFDIMELDMAYSSHVRSKTNMASMSTKKFNLLIDQGFQYQYMYNSFQINNGNNTFSDVSQILGLAKTDWSWGTLLADFDNDGLKDIVVTNGYQRDVTNRDFQNEMQEKVQDKTKKITDRFLKDQKNDKLIEEIRLTFQKAYLEVVKTAPKTKEANFLFQNKGNLTFEKVTKKWGFDKKVNSNGVAYSDLDNDGDLDLVINNLDEIASIYENQSNKIKNSNYLSLKLIGNSANPFAIGTKATIYVNNQIQVLELFPTRGFQSSVDHRLHFGLAQHKDIDSIKIRWPDQKITVLKNVKSNQILTIDYNTSKLRAKNTSTSKQEAFFSDISSELGLRYKHKENIYNDFLKEVLLPHKLSRLGPSIATGDINNDGLDDIITGGAKQQAMKLHLQDKKGSFKDAQVIDFYHDIKSEDVGSLLFDYDNDNDLDLYVCSGGNEYSVGDANLQDRLYYNNNGVFKKTGNLPEMHTSTQVVKAADFDQDGDLDLFVGGRLVPGKYPSAPRSYLLQNNNGRYTDVTEKYCKELMQPGMVTGAEFGDVDGDGLLDLTLIGEWMPMMVFLNKGTSFEKMPIQKESESLWFSLKAVDVDKDGDLDFVGGNLGKNSKFKGSVEKPFNIYADDFDNNGTWDMMMSSYEGDKNYPVRGRDCSSEQMPFITDSFPTFKAYAIAEITEICGPKIDTALHLTARGFYTSIFVNDGKGKFTMKKLPNEAQFSPTKDILVEDINKDGNVDLILVGNMYDTEVETVRYDAGRGCVLLGNGKGDFTPMSPNESGFFAWDNVKQIRKIKVGKKEVYLLAVNNGKLMAFEKKK